MYSILLILIIILSLILKKLLNIKYNNIDGIRIDYEDGFTLIKQSNTVPVLTVRFERKDEESLEKEKQKYLDLIKKISLEIN